MNKANSANSTSKIVAIGLAIVTLTVVTQSVTDPVNVTKLFLLGGFGFAAFGAAIPAMRRETFKGHYFILIALGFFLSASVFSLVMSNSPFVQSLYGVYGRNNGFLLYFLLVLSFLAILTLNSKRQFNSFLLALLVSGIVNIVYGLWVLAFGDFIGWSNPYGNLLGTLGNPNFIGSFYGMFTGLLFSFGLDDRKPRKIRVTAIALVPLTFIGIVESHAVQGVILFITAFAIVTFFYIRGKISGNQIPIIYLFLLGVGFAVALLGTLQKGPLSKFLYKESVSLRGEYWHAGWNTGISNPLHGAGFDAYGDWYRRSREASALIHPGIDTVSNASHNVYIDMFSFGGWPLFISYVAISLLIFSKIIKFALRNRKFDPVFATLATVWVCYQLQSVISINQIGLAIWGWTFGAAIVVYEKIDFIDTSISHPEAKKLPSKRTQVANVISPGVLAGIFGLFGLLLAVPPLSSDMKWRAAQLSQNANLVKESLDSSYMNPLNSFHLINVAGVFESNKLYDLAKQAAVEAVRFNPDSYESWRALYSVSAVTQKEKTYALKMMRKLDPLNPNPGNVTP